MNINRGNKKWYLAMCFAFVSIIFFACAPSITKEEDSKIIITNKITVTNEPKTEDITQSDLSEINDSGNNQGNIMNNGLYAKGNGWIYGLYTDGFLYRRSLDGKLLEKLSDEAVDCINVVGDYLFYRDIEYDFSGIRRNNLSNIYRMDTRTKKVIKVSNDIVKYFYVYKGQIYFSKVIEDSSNDKFIEYEIYQMSLDGTSKELIYSEKIKTDLINEEFVVDDNYIYFLSTDENSQICKYDIKNKKLIDISKYLLENNIKQVFNFIIDDNNIYFTIRMYDNYSDYPGDLYKMTKDGDKIERLVEGTLLYYNLDYNWIYYTWSEQDNSLDKLYKMRKDGTDKTEISNISTGNLNIIDSYIYCNGGPSLVELYKICSDGSGKFEVLN